MRADLNGAPSVGPYVQLSANRGRENQTSNLLMVRPVIILG